MMFPTRSTRDLLDRISIAWVNVFGGMKVLTLDGETGTRRNDIDHWARYNQIALKFEAPHQKAWLVERHDALIRSASQRAESHVIKESLCVSFGTIFGLVAFMHIALVSIDNSTH